MPIDGPFTGFDAGWGGASGGEVGSQSVNGPVLNNGTLELQAHRANGGTDLMFMFTLIWGSLSTPGDSPWTFEIPFTRPRPNMRYVVPAVAYDKSADRGYSGVGRLVPSPFASCTLTMVCYFGQNAPRVGPAVPFTWAVGDELIAGNALEAFSA